MADRRHASDTGAHMTTRTAIVHERPHFTWDRTSPTALGSTGESTYRSTANRKVVFERTTTAPTLRTTVGVRLLQRLLAVESSQTVLVSGARVSLELIELVTPVIEADARPVAVVAACSSWRRSNGSWRFHVRANCSSEW